jgi:hypothetical protein
MNRWTESEIQFIKDNYKTMDATLIANHLGRTISSVQIKANRLGVKKEGIHHYCENFFEDITTTDKAYWLGFIYADGYVCKDKNKPNTYYFGIELGINDKSHLLKFNKNIQGNAYISTRYRVSETNGKIVSGTVCSLRIYSTQMAKDLIKHGCCLNKSLVKEQPIGIPDEYMRDFVRGYFDGNGTIAMRYCGKAKRPYYISQISTGSKLFAAWLSEYLVSIGIENYRTHGRRNEYKICVCVKDSIKFMRYIYDESHEYLSRKYDLYKIAVYG